MMQVMPASLSIAPTSVLGLALTLDTKSPALAASLAALRARQDLVLAEPQPPFAAVSLETNDPRGDHAWIESLPGVLAVDVVFVEIVPDEPLGADAAPRPRRRSRDPLDDSPAPAGPVTESDPDFPAL